MESITVEEWELLSFFEVEPDMLEPGEPWPYNDSVYVVTNGSVSLSFAIHPFYKDVRIVVKQSGITLYDLSTMNVDDVKVHDDKEGERLEVVFSENNSLFLRLEPSISINHKIENET